MILGYVEIGKGQTPPRPRIMVVQEGESQLPATKCHKMLVGPGVNQLDPFPGYYGSSACMANLWGLLRG